MGVIRQSASATMIEFLPLPVWGNLKQFGIVSGIGINSYPDSIKLLRNIKVNYNIRSQNGKAISNLVIELNLSIRIQILSKA